MDLVKVGECVPVPVSDFDRHNLDEYSSTGHSGRLGGAIETCHGQSETCGKGPA